MAGLRPAKGALLESILFDAGTGPCQVDGCRGAFAYRSPERFERTVRGSIAALARLRSAWMPHMLGLCSISVI